MSPKWNPPGERARETVRMLGRLHERTPFVLVDVHWLACMQHICTTLDDEHPVELLVDTAVWETLNVSIPLPTGWTMAVNETTALVIHDRRERVVLRQSTQRAHYVYVAASVPWAVLS